MQSDLLPHYKQVGDCRMAKGKLKVIFIQNVFFLRLQSIVLQSHDLQSNFAHKIRHSQLFLILFWWGRLFFKVCNLGPLPSLINSKNVRCAYPRTNQINRFFCLDFQYTCINVCTSVCLPECRRSNNTAPAIQRGVDNAMQ